MPLPRPTLDDRSYEQLRDELVRRIPVYNPEWTDHNPSDPGITLIELFAYLGENLLYRFNQIPETAHLELLHLLQVPLRPARPACALVTITPTGAEPPLVARGSEVKAGKLSFATTTEVRALPVTATAVCKAARALPVEAAEPEVFAGFQSALDALDGLAPGEEPASYESETLPAPDAGLTVDFGQAVDGMLWVAVLATGDDELAALRQRLAGHAEAPLHLNLGFVPDLEAPPPEEIDPCPGAGSDPPTAAVQWQISTGRWDERTGAPVFLPLREAGNTTRGLTREGVVRLRLPTRADDVGTFELSDPGLAGTGELPPVLDDESEARILFWLRAFRLDGGVFGKVRYLGANAAEAEQTRRGLPELLGTGNGQPAQTCRLVHRPVVAGSLVLEVEGPDGWQPWQEVDGFHASGESDRHYVVDPEAGTVRFGNGLRGWPPQLGERIRAREYRYGGGAAGNVAAGAIDKIPAVDHVKVTNPLPAHGGAAAESVAEGLERIPGELRRRDRAVTAGDFAELARLAPGAVVGRAECLPRFHPRLRHEVAAGVVSVVVWPREDPAHPDAPRPDRHLLECVCRWLDARRLITTELHVIPPRYRDLAVAVGLAVKPGHGVEAVRRWVELVIRQVLAPLPPFGPEGEGWPLGRRVHGPELEAAALQVQGVEYLEGLALAEQRDDAWQRTETVELEADEVPRLAEITVVAGPPLEPGAAAEPPAPEKTPVPIPVLREVC